MNKYFRFLLKITQHNRRKKNNVSYNLHWLLIELHAVGPLQIIQWVYINMYIEWYKHHTNINNGWEYKQSWWAYYCYRYNNDIIITIEDPSSWHKCMAYKKKTFFIISYFVFVNIWNSFFNFSKPGKCRKCIRNT